MSAAWTCNLCDPPRRFEIEEFDPVGHIRSEHDPNFDVDRWSDGETVVADTTLEPRDFEAEGPK